MKMARHFLLTKPSAVSITKVTTVLVPNVITLGARCYTRYLVAFGTTIYCELVHIRAQKLRPT